MNLPKNMDSMALNLLAEADWPWSPIAMAFVKARNPAQEGTEEYCSHPAEQISYEELQGHHLVNPKSADEREAGLKWLRGRLYPSTENINEI